LFWERGGLVKTWYKEQKSYLNFSDLLLVFPIVALIFS